MPATYEPIATTTLSSAQATVTFSSISGSYTDLILVVNSKISSGSSYYNIQVNSDTGTNYSTTLIRGNGSSAASNRYSSQNQAYTSGSSGMITTSQDSNLIIQIMNYANTTTYKTLLTRDNNAGVETDAAVSLWRSTAAINSVSVFTGASTFASGSTFTLYGIKAA